MHIAHAENIHIHLPAGLALGSTLSASSAVAPINASESLAIHTVGHGEYWAGQGGHFICTLPAMHGLPARHLIAAAEENECTWGKGGEDVPGAASQYDGKANTAALVAHDGHAAAEWAATYEANGLKDFYLPSRLELLMCYLAAPQLFKKEGYYWSSSQCSRYYAWCQVFESGYSYGSAKDYELRARPVRTIQL
ncbi:MAG: DUF1566 domain-containing protein [Comamonas sp.]|uniref:DUF1566 domain-containing protein n=1 Tax=Comamonas sp. TaxID=34028 RepID=UPI0026491AC9|nr:DUF1566 domain-containing protein [Comamonas sp.]MDN5502980.1 DUF1566 domain-containing protein [Comamonas sp.]MDN5539602.1 DUF1566 domain-containing protein [Comamonas sp.]